MGVGAGVDDVGVCFWHESYGVCEEGVDCEICEFRCEFISQREAGRA